MKKGKEWLKEMSLCYIVQHKKEVERFGGFEKYKKLMDSSFNSLEEFIVSSFRLPLTVHGTSHWTELFTQKSK